MAMTLDQWQERLQSHFVQLASARSFSDFPLFALEHGLTEDEFDEITDGVPFSGRRAVPDFFVDDGFFVVGFDMDAAAVYDACEQRQMSRPKECIPGKACVCYCAQGTDCKPVSSCRSFERIKRLRTYNLPTGNFLGSEQQDGGRQLIAYGDCSWRYPQLPPTTVYVYATTINNERVAIINGASPALQTTQVDLSKPQS